MKTANVLALALALAATLAGYGAAAQDTGPKVRVLSAAEDATEKTVLVGRSLAGDMVIHFELEPAKNMWMSMGNPPKWMERPVGSGELFHVEAKPIDPGSGTRISYADVTFTAVNRTNGKTITAALHPMWGGSGLPYATNSGLAGDGRYEATITVGVPTFARGPKNKDLWMEPATAKFHFKLAGGKLTEVTEPMK
jgi:hypothetical protein